MDRHPHPTSLFARGTVAALLAALLSGLVLLTGSADADARAGDGDVARSWQGAKQSGAAKARKSARASRTAERRRGARAERRERLRRRSERRRKFHERKPPEAPAPAPEPTPEPTPTPTPEPAPEPAPDPEPTPEPAPEPTPDPSADLLYQANRLSDFWLRQSAPGAITEALDPAGSGEKVYKLTVDDNDVYPATPTENPRAEMLSPAMFDGGEEFWWSARFYLPEDFPSSTPNFVTLLQGPYGRPWYGTPPFHIEVNGGVIKWQRNSTYNWDVPWEMPIVRGRWVEIVIHERFDSNGFVEMWVDGKQVTFFSKSAYNPNKVGPTTRLNMQTRDKSNNENVASLYLMNYRKKGMFPSLTVYHGPLSVGSTRASVEG